MKPLLITACWILFGPLAAWGQIYTGPIPKPTSGYGAEGSYSVAIESFPNPNYPGEDIRIFYPEGISSPVPTIFYSHGFGGYDPANVLGLLSFVARKGYAMVFVPYQTTGVTSAQRYNNLLSGFLKAARDFPTLIDTTRVGFMGHSFGGGASFANAYHCFTQLNWGLSGRCMFASGQWYSLNISQAELQSFPADVKLVTMVYEHDSTNDHRMANDLFNTLSIPASEKDFLLVRSDTVGLYTYDAVHGVPNTASAFDALDYYALYRHLDALCDYTFHGSLAGKDVALGNGSANQVSMPAGMRPLEQSDSPAFAHPESTYTYPCSAVQNPRQAYCAAATSGEALPAARYLVIRNPVSAVISAEAHVPVSRMEVYTCQGAMVTSASGNSVPVQELANGLYLVKVLLEDHTVEMRKVLKE